MAGDKKRRVSGVAVDTPGSKKSRKSRKSDVHPVELQTEEIININDLPDAVLLNIFKNLGFPHRFAAMEVCKSWKALGEDPCFTQKVVDGDGTIMAAVHRAQPGDTISIPAGYYEELLLIEKPLKLVGEKLPNLWNQQARSVVLQSGRSSAALCDARACFQGITLRTGRGNPDRSIVGFGPKCKYIRLQDCEVAGRTGLLLPMKAGSEAKLVLIGCSIHSLISEEQSPAICVEVGTLIMTGCTLTNNDLAVEALKEARVDLRNNDFSFNMVALLIEGYGHVESNRLWGNLSRSPVQMESREALEDAVVAAPPGAPAGPEANGIGLANGAAAAPNAIAADGAAADQGPAEPAAPSDELPAAAAAAEGAANGAIGLPENSAAAAGEPGRTQDGVKAGAEAGEAGAHETRLRSNTGRGLYISNNHIRLPNARRDPAVTDDETRRKVRRLTSEVYGDEPHNWEDWEMINQSDLSDDDDDGSEFGSSDGSTSSSSSDSDGDSGPDSDDSLLSGPSSDDDDDDSSGDSDSGDDFSSDSDMGQGENPDDDLPAWLQAHGVDLLSGSSSGDSDFQTDDSSSESSDEEVGDVAPAGGPDQAP